MLLRRPAGLVTIWVYQIRSAWQLQFCTFLWKFLQNRWLVGRKIDLLDASWFSAGSGHLNHLRRLRCSRSFSMTRRSDIALPFSLHSKRCMWAFAFDACLAFQLRNPCLLGVSEVRPLMKKIFELTRSACSSASGSRVVVGSSVLSSASGDGVLGMQPIIFSVSRGRFRLWSTKAFKTYIPFDR